MRTLRAGKLGLPRIGLCLSRPARDTTLVISTPVPDRGTLKCDSKLENRNPERSPSLESQETRLVARTRPAARNSWGNRCAGHFNLL